MKSTSFITGKEGRLYIDDGGNGNVPLVIIPSLAGSTKQWAAQLSYFRKTRRVIAIDLRGHGESDLAKNSDYSIGGFTSDLETVVDHLKLDRPILLGHSFGGSVCVDFAGKHPSRVAALVLVDPALDVRKLPRDQFDAYLKGMRSDQYDKNIAQHWEGILKGASKEVHDLVMADLRKTPKSVVIGAFEAGLDFDPIAALGRFGGPKCSIITHLNESPFALHNLFPKLECKKIEDVSHWLQMDKPTEVNSVIEKFLERAD